jgi:outer membrane protein TolC
VQRSTERQRATAAGNALEKSKLQLARIIGLPIGQTFTLNDELPALPVPDITIDEALERAYKARPDYQAALERVHAAESTRRAVLGESLPSVRLNADFGDIGNTVGDARGTFAIAGAVSVPIFQGGRARARLAEADADLRARQAEADDLRAGIYYDVRAAFLDVQATGEQLQVAARARDLAGQQLTQARDRFAAGVADNIEVVQAQEAVTLAAEQYITALYGNSVAKALLARGLGVAEEAARRVFGGIR